MSHGDEAHGGGHGHETHGEGHGHGHSDTCCDGHGHGELEKPLLKENGHSHNHEDGCCGGHGHGELEQPLLKEHGHGHGHEDMKSLRGLTVRQLKAKARESGASDQDIDSCEDASDTKEALINLIAKADKDSKSGTESRCSNQSQAPPSQVTFGKPTPHTIRIFFSNGIKMMKSDETRQLLSDPSIKRPGIKLIEWQRAEWDPLGVDQDMGCNALNTLETDFPDDKELINLKMEFVNTASRTFLKSLVDRAPTTLEKKKRMPRETIIQFFEACNTQCGLPEFAERLAKHVQEHKKPPNQMMIDMQRGMLEICGFEKEHGCKVLGEIPKDFKGDQEMIARFSQWQQCAQQTCASICGPLMQTNPQMQQQQQQMKQQMKKQLATTIGELAKGSPSEVKESKAQLAMMTPSEKQEFANGMQKKMMVFSQLPADRKLSYIASLKSDDKMQLIKTLLIISDMMDQSGGQSDQKQQQESSGYGQSPNMMTMSSQGQSQATPQETPPAPPQQQMM